MATRAPASPIPIEPLRRRVRGRLTLPADAGYDAARTVLAGGIDRHPAAIVRVADAADVAAVVAFARDEGVELAVRGGGHSAAGHGVTEGGVVLDTRELTGLEIDAAGATAWAGAGLTAAAYTSAVAADGLATGFGDTGSVGIGGLTLGGGVGYLVRRHGLTIDSLLGAELVTAAGAILAVDSASQPDLFWAIRGGGGNFGVVTRFHYRLHPVDRVVGGMLVLPATPDVVAGFIAEADAAPDDLSTIANVMNCPPLPFVAEEHHGKLVVFAILCFAGDPAEGERVAGRFRGLAAPLADLVRPMPYPEIYPPDDPDYHPTAEALTMFVDRIGPPEAETILDRLAASDASMRVAQLRVLGGAMARVPDDATAFAHRRSRIMVNVAAFYDGPDDRPEKAAWVRDLVRDLRQDDPGAYVNFLGDEGAARIHAAYPGATWDRLAAIKARWDPTNLFRLNQNVPPAG